MMKVMDKKRDKREVLEEKSDTTAVAKDKTRDKMRW